MGNGCSRIDKHVSPENCVRRDRCETEHHRALPNAHCAADPGSWVNDRSKAWTNLLFQLRGHAGACGRAPKGDHKAHKRIRGEHSYRPVNHDITDRVRRSKLRIHHEASARNANVTQYLQ
jgi:hypothetical protein